MNLDLAWMLSDWPALDNDVTARTVVGRDGEEFVQLRVELGVLQMHRNGRPDGRRYHGMPTARDFVLHELRVHGRVRDEDWQELRRELQQMNYRRVATAALADYALRSNEKRRACTEIRPTLRDIEFCLGSLRLLQDRHPDGMGPQVALVPNLLFHRARLRTRLRACQKRYEEAVEAAEMGARGLEIVLRRAGLAARAIARDAGVAYLRQMSRRLRARHGIQQTLREKLAKAIEDEDFEAAARLRDELQRRGPRRRPRHP